VRRRPCSPGRPTLTENEATFDHLAGLLANQVRAGRAEPLKTPVRFTSTMKRQSFRRHLDERRHLRTPELLTTMSRRPTLAIVRSTRASTAA